MDPVELSVGSVRLRPWRIEDTEAVLAAMQDADIRLWNGFEGEFGIEDVGVWLTRRMDWSAGTHASWAVVGDAGTLLGSVSLHSINADQGDAEIGYWTVPAARGRGLASSVVDAVCRWAFATLPVDRIELCHAVENEASGRVAERAGFRQEGRLRRSYRYGDGVKHDELLWARLAEDDVPEVGAEVSAGDRP